VALLTTEKDFVRLGELSSNFSEGLPLKIVGLRVEIQDEVKAIEWVIARIDGRLNLAPGD
jgi:tetraacyldisaccharide-1-P 4'-kinase